MMKKVLSLLLVCVMVIVPCILISCNFDNENTTTATTTTTITTTTTQSNNDNNEPNASTGNKIALYLYQPSYDDSKKKLENCKCVGCYDYPTLGIESLLELGITASTVIEFNNENVTLDSIKDWKGDSVIVWVGHGDWSESNRSILGLSIPYSKALYDEYKQDFEEGCLVTNYETIGVTYLFFEKYLEEDALKNSIIYLGTCQSGKDDKLAQTLIDKGATAVYVNSNKITMPYNNKMCQSVLGFLGDGYTINEALEKAQDIHQKTEIVIDGLDKFETEVLLITNEPNFTLEELQNNISLKYTLNNDCESYSVTGIGNCTATDIVIPSEYNGYPVTSIDSYAFVGCTFLRNVAVPDSVSSIGYLAFDGCTSLTSITIPASVESLDSTAFLGCKSLACINVDENNQYYESIDGNLYTKGGEVLLQYSIGKRDSSFTIPNSVTYIGVTSFYGSTNLTSVVIPDSVYYIGNYAFENCTSLVSVTISSSLVGINWHAFSGCTSLESINFTGTKEQWHALQKLGGWDDFTGDYIIYCSDGTIKK